MRTVLSLPSSYQRRKPGKTYKTRYLVLFHFTRNSLLGNLFISSGEPGPVLKIHCKGRTGPKNLVCFTNLAASVSHILLFKVTCMREILAEAWPSESLGLGGIFRIVSGKVKTTN